MAPRGKQAEEKSAEDTPNVEKQDGPAVNEQGDVVEYDPTNSDPTINSGNGDTNDGPPPTGAMAEALNNPNEDNSVTTVQRDWLPEGMVSQGVKRKDGSFVGQQVAEDETKS